MKLRAILFDLDGTLTQPNLDFDAIRQETGMPEKTPILEYLKGAAEAEVERVMAVLERHEEEAAKNSELAPGALEVLALARRQGIKIGIITRNSRRSVKALAARHGIAADVAVARDDAPPKPSPEPVLRACRAMGVAPEETIMVGDYLFDMQAGKAAGASTAYLEGAHKLPEGFEVDFRLRTLSDLMGIIR